MALTNNRKQQADTGTKMIHMGKNSKSIILSKGISAGKGRKQPTAAWCKDDEGRRRTLVTSPSAIRS